MAFNAHLRYIFCICLTSILIHAEISDLRLCGDEECKTQVSEARTLIRYNSNDPKILSFPLNTIVKVYSKSAGSNPDLWGVEISGKRGYVPKQFIREMKILIPKNKLTFNVPTELQNSSSKNEKSQLEEKTIESSETKSILTQSIESLATFTNEFPASFDKLSTSILKQVLTSAESITVTTKSIENVTLDVSNIKSDSPIVEDLSDLISESSTNVKWKFQFLTCDLMQINETCVYTFGSVLARVVLSRLEMKEIVNSNSIDESQTVKEVLSVKKDLTAANENDENDEDDDDDDSITDIEDDESLESSESENLSVESSIEQLVTDKSDDLEPPAITQTSIITEEIPEVKFLQSTVADEGESDVEIGETEVKMNESDIKVDESDIKMKETKPEMEQIPLINVEKEAEDTLNLFEELGRNLELMIEYLPESVQLAMEEHVKMGVSPRVTIFTTITGFLLILLMSIYFLIKRGNKERVLIVRLCNLDRKLFVVTAERDLLKENAEKVSESAIDYEEKFTKVDESLTIVNDRLATAKDENEILQNQLDKLQEELEKLENDKSKLKSDNELKDTILNQLDEEHEMIKDNFKSLENQVDNLQDELSLKSQTQNDNEHRIVSLNEQITQLEQSNNQLLQEAQIWNQTINEIQQQNELLNKQNQIFQSEIAIKNKEIETLKETTFKLESLETEDDSETKIERMKKLFDVSLISNELKATTTKLTSLEREFDLKLNDYMQLETQFDSIVKENQLLKEKDVELKQERNDAVTKLHVLSDYFKEKEIELQKELGVQEAMRQQMEESTLSVTEKAELYEKEVKLHRSHIDALKKEMDNQIRSYKTQITLHESKSHKNWLAARAAERRAEEAKQEAAILRNKLSSLEQDTQNRSQTDESRTTPIRREVDNINGDLSSPQPPLPLRRFPILPLDRPMPPPPFMGDRMPMMGPPRPMFDLPPPMMPPPMRDFFPPGRRPPSPPFRGPFREASPPRFYDRPNIPNKRPIEPQFIPGPPRYPSPYSGLRKTSPPSDAGNTSV